MGQYRNYTDEQVIEYAKEVKSISQLLKKLGLRPAGGNFAHMKKTLQRLEVDCSSWGGTGWSKGQQLKDWSKYSQITHLKKHLIPLKGHCCERCKNETWQDNLIPLEVHHKDHDRTNNELSNLELLCCNCHALTENWRNKKVVRSVGPAPTLD